MSLLNLAFAIRGTEYLPPYLIYDGCLGIIMIMQIATEKYLWNHRLTLYERDYFKWQAHNKNKHLSSAERAQEGSNADFY